MDRREPTRVAPIRRGFWTSAIHRVRRSAQHLAPKLQIAWMRPYVPFRRPALASDAYSFTLSSRSQYPLEAGPHLASIALALQAPKPEMHMCHGLVIAGEGRVDRRARDRSQ